MKVAVIGGGATGCAIAADLSLKGVSVALYEDATEYQNCRDVIACGGIKMMGRGVTGFARIDLVTDDLALALRDAQFVFVAEVANRHDKTTDALAGLLTSGQTVCFSAGGCGSILLKNKLPHERRVVVGETEGNLFPCRLVDKAVVTCAFSYSTKKAAAFPAADTCKLLEALAAVYPCEPATNVLEAALNSPNLAIHLCGVVLNVGQIERMEDFRLYRDGLTPTLLRIADIMEQEKSAVQEALGYRSEPFSAFRHRVYEYNSHPELDDFRCLSGPDSVRHRYLTEDPGNMLSLLLSIGELAGVCLPVTRSFVTIAGAISGQSYPANGKRLESYGFTGKTVDDLNEYLQNG